MVEDWPVSCASTLINESYGLLEGEGADGLGANENSGFFATKALRHKEKRLSCNKVGRMLADLPAKPLSLPL